MKKLLSIVLFCLLMFGGVAYAKDIKPTTEQDSAAAVFTGPGFFAGISITTDGTNNVSVDIYDNTAASGKQLTQTLVFIGTDRVRTFSVGNLIKVDNGIYVNLTCSGTYEYVVYYADPN